MTIGADNSKYESILLNTLPGTTGSTIDGLLLAGSAIEVTEKQIKIGKNSLMIVTVYMSANYIKHKK